MFFNQNEEWKPFNNTNDSSEIGKKYSITKKMKFMSKYFVLKIVQCHLQNGLFPIYRFVLILKKNIKWNSLNWTLKKKRIEKFNLKLKGIFVFVWGFVWIKQELFWYLEHFTVYIYKVWIID